MYLYNYMFAFILQILYSLNKIIHITDFIYYILQTLYITYVSLVIIYCSNKTDVIKLLLSIKIIYLSLYFICYVTPIIDMTNKLFFYYFVYSNVRHSQGNIEH